MVKTGTAPVPSALGDLGSATELRLSHQLACSYRTPRPLRVQFCDALYHVTARGDERKPILPR